MRVEKISRVTINRRPFVVNLDVTRSEVGMVSVTVESEHEVPIGFDPIEAVVFVVDIAWIPEPDFQACGLSLVDVVQKDRGFDVGEDVAWAST